MKALAADHRNDVVATVVALVFGIIGKRIHRSVHDSMQRLFSSLASKAIDGEIKPRELSVIDPVGKCRRRVLSKGVSSLLQAPSSSVYTSSSVGFLKFAVSVIDSSLLA